MPVIFTEEIKKSRFITLLGHTEGVEAAKAFVVFRFAATRVLGRR
ncbi:FIG000605: protein co-occurring with transport systems (COG1739) [Cronobacter malonaticus 507]|nr:FIG000605: protein co-occurring with transport systems (COG1739) [Cronobacter malonaticus 507]